MTAPRRAQEGESCDVQAVARSHLPRPDIGGHLGRRARGPLAEWQFDEGKGDFARDSSGHGRDAKLHGATWARQGAGSAISLDGEDDYVEFSDVDRPLGLAGPVSVAAWVKPTRKAQGMSVVLGQDLHSYLVTLYATDLCYWYIGRGSNGINTKVKLHEWNHIAATFDGKRLALWLNGREAAGRKSAVQSYAKRDRFIMGTRGRPDLPRFKGLLDNVRVYGRALTEAEVVALLTKEAAAHGIAVRTQRDTPSAPATRFFEAQAGGVALKETQDAILFANRHVGLELQRSEKGFELSRLYGIAGDQDFLAQGDLVGARDLFEIVMTLDPKHIGRDDRLKEKGSLFGIMAEMAGEALPIGSQAAKSVSWRRSGTRKTTRFSIPRDAVAWWKPRSAGAQGLDAITTPEAHSTPTTSTCSSRRSTTGRAVRGSIWERAIRPRA